MRGTRTSIRKLVHQHSVRVVALNFRVARSIEAIRGTNSQDSVLLAIANHFPDDHAQSIRRGPDVVRS